MDGKNNIFVASFSSPLEFIQEPPVVNVVRGKGEKELLYSFSNPSLQHLTALQIDSSGNVWVANNWSLATTPPPNLAIFGGDGVVQFVVLAKPVVKPLVVTAIPAN